jgi:Ca-activated chloride channel family protein
MRKNLGEANMFAFGIGTAVNRHIIEGMARVGMGEPFIITKPEEAPAQAERFRKMIQSPVLTRVKVNFQGFSAYDVEPLAVPDVLADRPSSGNEDRRRQNHLNGIQGNGSHRGHRRGKAKCQGTAGLRYLWARHRVPLLGLQQARPRPADKSDRSGLAYNLLTAYTFLPGG